MHAKRSPPRSRHRGERSRDRTADQPQYLHCHGIGSALLADSAAFTKIRVSVQLVGSVLTWAVSGQHGDGRAAGVVVKRVGYVLEEAAGLQAAGGVR
jgi:hypothetical protein